MSTKRKFTTKLGQPVVKPSAKPIAKEILNDSRTVVSRGGNAEHTEANGSAEDPEIISSDEESSEDEEEEESDEEEEESDEEEKVVEQEVPQISKENEGGDLEMKDAEDKGENEDPVEPSFGDLIFANSTEPVDVAGAFNSNNLQALSYPQSTKLQPPTGASLGTVLTQALKTNDITLLESCLQTPDTNTIRATIQRLDSLLAGSLLQKLAERLHRRPGRAGSLMVWVQWTLVTHGGYLATQPDLIKKLAELNRVIDERARGLQSLLSLKGKLDMLEAQMQLRQSMRAQHRREQDDEDDEEGVVYVEGEEEDDEPDGKQVLSNGKLKGLNGLVGESGAESEVSEDMPAMTNGAIVDSDAEESEEDDDDALIDEEAEETDNDSGNDEDDIDHSDVDEADEEDESDDAAPVRPPTKLQRIGGLFSRSR